MVSNGNGVHEVEQKKKYSASEQFASLLAVSVGCMVLALTIGASFGLAYWAFKFVSSF